MYTVVTRSPEDGTFVDEFGTLHDAEGFASDLTAEGCTCTICKQLRTIEAKQPMDENADIYCPPSMTRPVHTVRVA